MAFLNMTLHSPCMSLDTHVNVILPHDITRSDEPCKVIYLFHGLSDDCTKWTRFTSLERYVNGKHVAIVMPEVAHSWYTDMRHGIAYFKFVSEELPAYICRAFNVSDKREDTFIAGLSMGGYGALKTAFSFPERYAKVAAFSSVCDLRHSLEDPRDPLFEHYYGMRNEFVAICGESCKFGDHEDNRLLAEKALAQPQHPDVLMTCGESDQFYPSNLAFVEHMNKIGYPVDFRSWAGHHNWQFWDESLPKMLAFFGV